MGVVILGNQVCNDGGHNIGISKNGQREGGHIDQCRERGVRVGTWKHQWWIATY